MNFAVQRLGEFLACQRGDRLDGTTIFAETDLLLSFALDVDGLLDAGRAVLQPLPVGGLNGRGIGQFVMETLVELLTRYLGGPMSLRSVGNLVFRVEPGARRHETGKIGQH